MLCRRFRSGRRRPVGRECPRRRSCRGRRLRPRRIRRRTPSVTPAAPAAAQESAEDDPAEDRAANPAAPSLYTARTVPVPVRPHILFGQAPRLPGQRAGLMSLGQRTLRIVRAASSRARSSRRWASASRVRAWLPTAPRFVVM